MREKVCSLTSSLPFCRATDESEPTRRRTCPYLVPGSLSPVLPLTSLLHIHFPLPLHALTRRWISRSLPFLPPSSLVPLVVSRRPPPTRAPSHRSLESSVESLSCLPVGDTHSHSPCFAETLPHVVPLYDTRRQHSDTTTTQTCRATIRQAGDFLCSQRV